MSKSEVLEKMMNSENGGLIAAIAGIVAVFGIDRITKYHYSEYTGPITPSFRTSGNPYSGVSETIIPGTGNRLETA